MHRLGEYEVVRAIARGGMGSVFEVRHPRSNAAYAAKVLLRCEDPAARDRFRREAELLARCDRHPGIVKIHGIGEAQGNVLYMILDLVRGEDLGDVLTREHRLEARRVAEIGRQVAEALAFVHRLGVVHRDVKPSNVLLDDKGRCQLTDFGVATATDLEKLTRTGMFIGTLRFVAPEQACGVKATPAADVFALGCILYRALAGVHISEDLEGTVYLAWLAGVTRAPDVRLLAPLTPEPLARIVAKALEKDPLERYASGREIADDLAAFLADKPVRAGAPPRGHRALVAGAGAALVLLVAVGAGAAGWSHGAAEAAPVEAVSPVSEALEVRLKRARAHIALKQTAEALALVQGAEETPAVLEVKGDAAMIASDWKGAATAYGRALRIEPSLRVKRCEAAALAGDEATASSDLRPLLAGSAPKDARLAPALYRRALAGKDPVARRSDFEAALLLAPPHPSVEREVALALNEIATAEAKVWGDGLMSRIAVTDADMERFHATYALLVHAYAIDRNLPKEGFGNLLRLFRGLQKQTDRKRLAGFANIFLRDWPDEPLWLYLRGYGEAEGTDAERRSALQCFERAADGYQAPPPDEEPEVKHLAGEIARNIMNLSSRIGVETDMERSEKMAFRSEEADAALQVAERWRQRGDLERARGALAKARDWKNYKDGQPLPQHVILEEELAIQWADGKRSTVMKRVEKLKTRGSWGVRIFTKYAKQEGRWQEIADLVDPATDEVWCLIHLCQAFHHLGRRDEALTAFKRLETFPKVPRDEMPALRDMLGLR